MIPYKNDVIYERPLFTSQLSKNHLKQVKILRYCYPLMVDVITYGQWSRKSDFHCT